MNHNSEVLTTDSSVTFLDKFHHFPGPQILNLLEKEADQNLFIQLIQNQGPFCFRKFCNLDRNHALGIIITPDRDIGGRGEIVIIISSKTGKQIKAVRT